MLGYDSFQELATLDIETSGYHPDYSRDKFKSLMKTHGFVVGFESGWIKKDGSVLFVKESAWAVRDDTDAIICYDGICEDITQWKLTDTRIKEDLKKYEILVECGNDGIVIVQDGALRFVNRQILRLTGYTESQALGKAFWTFVPENQQKDLREHYRRRLADQAVPSRYETEILTQTGETIPVEWSASIIEIDGRKADMAIIRDISQRKQAELQSRKSMWKIEQLHEVGHKLSRSHNAKEVFQLTIDAAERILNLTWCDISVEDEGILTPQTRSRQVPPGISRVMSVDEGYAGETFRSGRTLMIENVDSDENMMAGESGLKSLISAPIHTIGVFQAFSNRAYAFSHEDVKLLGILLGHVAEALKRINLQIKLIKQATRDSLTGVFNRHYLHQEMNREINRCERYGHLIAVMMIDIDRFKEINDTFGHQVGDKVLVAVAESLIQSVRECDTVIRYGGDEYLIIMPETSDKAVLVRERIDGTIAGQTLIPELERFPVSLSIGIAVWDPGSGQSFEEAVHKADTEMYREKRKTSL